MNKTIRAFALASLIALCLGLVACGSSSSSSTASTSASASAAPTSASAASESASASAASASAASSSASAASSSASAASASAASSSASAASASSESASSAWSDQPLELTDDTFHDVFEKDGNVFFDGVGVLVNKSSKTLSIKDFYFAAVDENSNVIAEPRVIYISPNYVLPGKTAYIYPGNAILLPEGSSVDGAYYVGVSCESVPTDKTVVEYPITNVVNYDDGGYPTIGGVVTNDTSVASGTITVIVSYYDSNTQLVGVAEDEISNLDPDKSANLRIMGSDLQHRCTWDKVASYELHATALQ